MSKEEDFFESLDDGRLDDGLQEGDSADDGASETLEDDEFLEDSHQDDEEPEAPVAQDPEPVAKSPKEDGPPAESARNALAAFEDNDYPFTGAKQSRLSREEIEKRQGDFAEAFLANPHGAIIELIGPTLERYLDERDTYRQSATEMKTDEEFLSAHQSEMKKLESKGYSQLEAYGILRELAPKPKRRQHRGKRAGSHTRKPEKLSASDFLKEELEKEMKRSGR